MKLFYQWFHKRFQQVHAFFTDPTLSVFLLSVGYHLSLYLSTSNTTLLLLTAAYAFLIYQRTRSVGQTLLLVFLATLPFAKGKGAQIILVPRELIPRYALFKISYFFPLYLSDFVLFLALCWYARERFLLQKRLAVFPRGLKTVLTIHLVFTLFATIHTVLSTHREVVFLSVLQLFKMLFVLTLPWLLAVQHTRAVKQRVLSVLTASLLFQVGWALWQAFSGGPLGRHIEATLPGFESGIVASETGDLLRVSGTFYEPSILGTFLMMGVIALLAARKSHFFSSRRLFQLAGLAAAGGALALIFTGSRGLYGIFLMLVAVLMRDQFSLLAVKTFLKKKALLLLAAVALAGPYIAARATTLADVFTPYGTASYRLAMIGYALRVGLAAPLGIGLNLSPWFLATGFLGERYVFDPTYPHNIFAQLFLEVGIIGLLLFASFCFFAFKNTRKNTLFFLPLVAFFAAAQLYPIFLNHQEILGFFYLSIGLAFWSQPAAKKIS